MLLCRLAHRAEESTFKSPDRKERANKAALCTGLPIIHSAFPPLSVPRSPSETPGTVGTAAGGSKMLNLSKGKETLYNACPQL